MTKSTLKPLAIALLASAPFAADAATQAASLPEILSKGSAALSFRYRYEFVDQDGIAKDADASTLKTRLTWDSAVYQGFAMGLEFDNVTVMGNESYNSTVNGETQYPVVADPDGTDVNQAFLRYATDSTKVTFGRQRILHAGQRFIGGVGWRQNEQTFDSFRVETAALGPVTVDYSYIWDVQRIFGPDDGPNKHWNSDSHALLLGWVPTEGHKLSFFTYLLDFEDSLINSSATYGIDYAGALGPLTLAASYATQSDYADNPVDYSADYYMVEVGSTLKGIGLAAGYEVMGSDDGVMAFSTPLATLHKFDGWADKFLGTPANGLEDAYLKISGKIGPFALAAFYHDFSANEGSMDYGSEVDLVGSYPINPNVALELKYANYDADELFTDTEKLWMTVNVKF